jgi:hypothetical protein
MKDLAGVVWLLNKEQDRLTRELRGIGPALAAFGIAYGKGTGTRKLSASARTRIAAAQKARLDKDPGNSEACSKAYQTHTVRRRAEEDRRCTKGEMGEGGE